MDLLRRFAGLGRNVQPRSSTPRTTPPVFTKEPEAKGLRKIELEAMRRLFSADKFCDATAVVAARGETHHRGKPDDWF